MSGILPEPIKERRVIDRLIGDPHESGLEARLYFIGCLVICFGGFTASLLNLVIDMKPMDQVISAAVLVSGVLFLVIGHRMEHPEKLAPVAIILIAAALCKV